MDHSATYGQQNVFTVYCRQSFVNEKESLGSVRIFLGAWILYTPVTVNGRTSTIRTPITPTFLACYAFRGLTSFLRGGIVVLFGLIRRSPEAGMPFRIFGAGSAQVRLCPACERKLKVDATFCPSCYMVFRPEGSAALREHLQGGRVPGDVYLLRKMHTEDPNAGPVMCAVGDFAASRTPPDSPASPPTLSSTPAVSAPEKESVRPNVESLSRQSSPTGPHEPRNGRNGRPHGRSRNGVEGFLAFAEPLPPPARSAEDVPGLYAWMLDRDPVIPNNLARLQAIHGDVFRNAPAARLGYEQHLLLQVTEDLSLYMTEDALGFHLSQLAAAYRRAADAYRKTEDQDSPASNRALWQMASTASRMRIEAWVYHARHGEAPQLPSSRQRELPLKFPGH